MEKMRDEIKEQVAEAGSSRLKTDGAEEERSGRREEEPKSPPSKTEGGAPAPGSAWWKSGTGVVVWIALGTVVAHVATGWRYGFDRDELMALEDARHLAWGYVTYPPMTAFFGRVALMLFGTSLVGFRFFAAVAQAVALVLTGLMAKELGGGKWAQVTATLAGVPFCLGAGALMQYISFDYVCWVLVAYCMVRVLGAAEKEEKADSSGKLGPRNDKSRNRLGDERWWLGVGAGIGLGMMAKYTMGFLAAGVAAGVLLQKIENRKSKIEIRKSKIGNPELDIGERKNGPPQKAVPTTDSRNHLKSGWLWGGVLLAAGIFVPNVLWQWHRDFVSLEFLRFIHERDVQTGLTEWFLPGQMEMTLLALPLAAGGIYFYFFAEEGKAYRALGWMYAVPLVLFVAMRGRDYYLAPAYPMLYAAGAVWVEKKIGSKEARKQRSKETEKEEDNAETQRTPRFAEKSSENGKWRMENGGRASRWAGVVRGVVWAALMADVLIAAAVGLPIAPVNSTWWKLAAKVNIVFPEEIGWPEFVETVAQVRDRLPAEERARAGILAGNYGELGALNLYGEKYGLPRAISGVNSSWERGYGDPAPETLIVVGYSREFLEKHFASCEVAGRVWNKYGVANEETREDADIFVCRGLKESWAEFWKGMKKFA
jgi:hypothetical protein